MKNVADPIAEFKKEVRENIRKLGDNKELKHLAARFMHESIRANYSYNFTWLGRPIIQHPQDMVAVQELIWSVKPDLVIETGIAHGGSLILSASILELIGKGIVLGIDIDIRKHNHHAIVNHPLSKRIVMIEGSSVDPDILDEVGLFAHGEETILVFLDSCHSHAHVLKELELYAPFVTKGSYLVVFDTVAEDLPEGVIKDRPWGKGNSPKTAVHEFLKHNHNFEIDKEIENKLLITSAPDGFLKRIRS